MSTTRPRTRDRQNRPTNRPRHRRGDNAHETDAEPEADVGRSDLSAGIGDVDDESSQDRLRELFTHTRQSDRQIANPDNLEVTGDPPWV